MSFFYFNFLLLLQVFIHPFVLADEPLNYDFRKRGFRIDMDSRIAVDGKRICFRYVDKTARTRCESIKNCQTTALRQIQEQINKLKKTQQQEKLNLLIDRALITAFKEATLAQSVGAFEEAIELAKLIDRERFLELLAMLGVVHLRLGELQNCIENHNAESCIFPLSKQAQHKNKSGSQKSLEIFYSYLKEKPDDDHVKWLVNILHMTLGSYPSGVPKKYFINLDKIASETSFPPFINIAQDIGLNQQTNFGGVSVADFNGDHYKDIIFGSLNQCESIKFYQYDRKTNRYLNKSISSGLSHQLGGGLIVTADYDNDGDQDIFITRGAWHPGGRDYPTQGGFAFNTLMENNGAGVFTDVTKRRGLLGLPNSTLSANWGDVNNDGKLDLFVSNESSDSELYLNRGSHFENFTSRSGIVNKAIGKGSVLADLNNDGNLDLIISNYAAPNRIFFGRGNGQFDLKATLAAPEYGFPTAVFDYDNDGLQDILIAAFAPDIDNFAKWLQDKPNKGETQRMYKNLGNGSFKDVTKELGLDRISLSMSINFGDINNDGFIDIYLGTGANSLGDLEPNQLYLNDQGKRFLNITNTARVGSLQKGHGISFVDLNHDGFQDIVLQQGGSSHADRFFPAVFINPTIQGNAFIEVSLRGEQSNRQGLHSHALVKVLDDKNQEQKFHSWIGSTGSFGTNPPSTIIGLGKIKKIISLQITWHGSKKVQTFHNLEKNAHYEIREGAVALTQHHPKKIKFALPEADHKHQH